MVDQVSTIEVPQTPRAKPRFLFSEKSSVIDAYESFAKEGFADLLTDYANTSANHARFPYEQEKKFLSKVDLDKGPILVSIGMMIRTMAVDWDSPKRERKEYLYYTVQLEAKDRLGNIIRCSHENEGKYSQQTKHIKTKIILILTRKRLIMRKVHRATSVQFPGIKRKQTNSLHQRRYSVKIQLTSLT
jgi:hypothetical protein